MRTALLLGLLLAVPTASALVGLPDLPLGGQVIVGYRDGALDPTLELVGALGADVTDTNERLGFVVARTTDVTGLLSALLGVATIEYVEEDDRTHLDGAQWNGAQWNAVEVDGAQWNGEKWDETDADGAEWNGGTGAGEVDPGLGWQWGLDRVRAPAAWNTTRGSGSASLCVLDTGVDLDHPDLAANLARGYNAISPGASPDDDAGHGSHIAGIAAAAIGNGFGTAGIGNVRIMPVKVLDATGNGHESDLAAGLTWCADAGADVAVMALSVDDDGPTVRSAIEYATSKDVLLLASAGNRGCDGCVGFPARHADVVAVGALDEDGGVASFSSRGGALDLAAPGDHILSTFSDGGFRYGTGTSQAVAFAAGAATLVRDAHPELGADATRERLTQTARDVGKSGWDAGSGKGLVDVAAAIR